VKPSFPTIAAGEVVQLPLQRTWRPAQELVQTPGGHWWVRTLPTGECYEWQLKYTGLTQSEAQSLREFHTAMGGAWHSFRFCDPLRNLLAWSEDQTQAIWSKTAGLTVSLFPNPGAQGATLANTASTEGQLAQVVGCDPTLNYSVAVTARSASGAGLGVLIGGARRDVALTAQWQTVQFSATPGGAQDQVGFALAVPAGASVDIAGVMAECGATAAEYRYSDARQGLFTEARFQDDALVVSGTEPGVYAATLRIVASAEE
jgi:hypothetical protein